MPRHWTRPLLGAGGAGMPLPAAGDVSAAPLSHAATNNAATLTARRAPVLFRIGGGACHRVRLASKSVNARGPLAGAASVLRGRRRHDRTPCPGAPASPPLTAVDRRSPDRDRS